MSHVTIRRQTIRFGALSANLATGRNGFCSVPGPSIFGSGQVAAIDAAALAGYISTYEQASQQIAIPRSNGALPVAISIAPDSPICSADIALGGSNGEDARHRLSPGNPLFLACDGPEIATVTIPCGIPLLSSSVGGVELSDVNWDALPASITPGFVTPAWPLRLEFWYGAAPVRSRKRAPLIAHVVTSQNANTRRIRVCTDGRERIDVTAYCESFGATITMSAIEALKVSGTAAFDQPTRTTLPLTDAGATSVALTTGDPNAAFSFFGNPITILEVQIVGAAGLSVNQIRVKAYD